MKRVVISGANRGIGLALARAFKAQGDDVYAVCRSSSTELDALNVSVIQGIDITCQDNLATLAQYFVAKPIDILINNAGILRSESLNNINPETILEQFKVNALAALQLTDQLKGSMPSGAKVALITSRMGSVADNSSGGYYGYRMSKAALNALGMSLSVDLAPKGVSVGIYHPGYVQTDMVNNEGDISPAEAARRIKGLIDQQDMAQTGVFKHSNGEVLPW